MNAVCASIRRVCIADFATGVCFCSWKRGVPEIAREDIEKETGITLWIKSLFQFGACVKKFILEPEDFDVNQFSEATRGDMAQILMRASSADENVDKFGGLALKRANKRMSCKETASNASSQASSANLRSTGSSPMSSASLQQLEAKNEDTESLIGIMGVDDKKRVFSMVIYDGLEKYTPFAQLIANEVVAQFLSTNPDILEQVAPTLESIAKNKDKPYLVEQEMLLNKFAVFLPVIEKIIADISQKYAKDS